MPILHDFNLRVARGQSLCLIRPNGAGKSTAFHAIYGHADIFTGRVVLGDGARQIDITKLAASEKLRRAGIAYILQDTSVFPDMTVEENLWMGGYLLDPPAHRGHYGLAGLREQARMIGATLTIDSAPQQGTAISVELAPRS